MADSDQVLNLEDEMRSSFMDYAMSVIISRALPDARDGLKPVHRRILYGMHQLRNTHSQPYKKSARIVGDVMGKFHPHGDSAIYDALVRLAQDFSMRYPIVDGQGNFGSIDGDSAAAMRYTEVRMRKLAAELLADLEKETVDWQPNYDGKELEPQVLPTKVPNLLLNGAVGIAVGMATNIPPHNLTELLDASLALIDDPKIETPELISHVKGPDFPTGGLILGTAGIQSAYLTGRGSVPMRARATIEEDKKGRESIIVSEIPYQVNKTRLIEKIAGLVKEKRIEGISDIQDYSDRTGMRIWIQCKRDASAQIVLNRLYKLSDLQTTFSVHMIAIVNGRPEVLTLRRYLETFVDHRRTVVTRRCRFELRKAIARREIVEGLGVAVDAIDRIIEIIRASPDPVVAKASLMQEPLQGFAGFLERCGRPAEEVEAARGKPYTLNERQAKAILDMRLQRLTGLEREKTEAEYKELCVEIAGLEAILTDDDKLMAVIREELVEIRHGYGDAEGQDSGDGALGSKGSRRTEIVANDMEITPIDLVKDESMVVMLSHRGYIKRLPTSEYRVQNRGGVGVKAGAGRDGEDWVVELFEASAHSYILMFTNTGRVFRKRVFELPKGSRDTKAKALVNFLDLKDDEKVLNMVPYKEDELDGETFVVLSTKRGYIKRTDIKEYSNIRSSGLIAATIADGDQMIGASLTDGHQHIMMVSQNGMAIRFEESDVRPMGRSARGVKGMNLRDGDEVVAMRVLHPESQRKLLTVCEKGYGKRTPLDEYRTQSRSGLGLITIKVTDRNGPVVGVLETDDSDQLMVVTESGKVVRTPVDGISIQGRSTQGVRIIRIGDDDRVVGLEKIAEDDELPGDDVSDDSEATNADADAPESGDADASPDADAPESGDDDAQDSDD